MIFDSPAPAATDVRSETEERSRSRRLPWLALSLVWLASLSLLAYLLLGRLGEIEDQIGDLGRRVEAVAVDAETAAARAERAENRALEAEQRATAAEDSAAVAAHGRAQAEARAASARARAEQARREAALAREEADKIKQEWQQEVDRLEQALQDVVETRKTALGLVMNLGEDYLKFDFDKATLRPENKELLSRIAGIMLTSRDYRITITGHTDDVGSDAYNQKLSERRARAVRDYLVETGIDPAIITTEGYGKKQPLVKGTSESARAKNRRVEIGIVSTRITYPGTAAQRQ